MKSVLISIKPKWCKLIESGKKTIEVRKTKPKCDVPFKCYIYCTMDKHDRFICRGGEDMPFDVGNGTVIGEFVCDEITEIGYTPYLHGQYEPLETVKKSCIPQMELFDYLKGEYGYGWHISDLVIYDEPKKLREFSRICEDMSKCEKCVYLYTESNESIGYYAECCSPCEGGKPLKRPPQSWCYVERCEE